ncbi:XRE family transcriptional regulator [Intestinimonas timonensis]|uniref:XRE family transcriptional regulator n=1 Tax=Intestinimonas timonensis TaxID=1689270 RepID=UPI001F5F5840|nr:XRE family transcriptional regulator [Intestinimonas timonensis]
MGHERMTLRLYDTNLLTFAIMPRTIGFEIEIVSVNERYKELFPVNLELTNDGVLKWLGSRSIPKNRSFVKEILQSLGLKPNDLLGILRVCKGLSLNDSYWIVPEGFDGKFSDCNLYENSFSEALALVAYTGRPSMLHSPCLSPELTTDGMLPKAWRKLPDGIYLYKGNTSQTLGGANSGNEPYSEYYAAQIAKTMGLNAISYGLERWKGILSSTCRLFTDIDTSYVAAGKLIKNVNITKCLDYADAFNPECSNQIRSMMIFDCLICNEDRHFGNFGVLRDNHTGRILGPAPLFDYGLGLFSQALSTDLESEKSLTALAEQYAPYYPEASIDDICRLAGKQQKRELLRLIDFHFKRHPLYNWPEHRLKITERVIHERARWLYEKI